jgi:F-type H+-transporting ATPase subunit h
LGSAKRREQSDQEEEKSTQPFDQLVIVIAQVFPPSPPPIGLSSSSADKMFTSLRVSTTRSAISAAARVARVNSVRGFIAPTVSRRADFVQELYLKELKAYKPAPVKDSDSTGQVQTFSAPKAPKSPEEADLATSLKEYENMAVEVEGNEGATSSSTPAVIEDWLVEEEEEEETAHH